MIIGCKEIKKAVYVLIMAIMVIIGIVILLSSSSSEQNTDVDKSNATQVNAVVREMPLQKDFFAEYRIERERLRSERADLLREEMKGAKSDDERQQDHEKLLELMHEKETEAETENMIRAKGFEDVIIICREDTANAIVRSDGLSKAEAEQIADIIHRFLKVKSENITISSK